MASSAIFARVLSRLNIAFQAYSDPSTAAVTDRELALSEPELAALTPVRPQMTYESARDEYHGEEYE